MNAPVTDLWSLVAPEGGPITSEAVAAALLDEFSVRFGPSSVIRDADLDTFDRRLDAAGFSLHHLSDSVDQRLVLTSPGADVPLTMPITTVRWPALVIDLPPGAMREALAPVASIRALMVLDEQTRRIRHGEVCNEDQKIVARLELVEEGPDAMAAPARLGVRPLRGYGGEARRAYASSSRPDFVRSGRFAMARSATPLRCGRSRSTGQSVPATALLVTEWSAYLAAMRDNLPGVLDDVDTEFLHDSGWRCGVPGRR